MRGLALRDGHDATGGVASASEGLTDHLVDIVDSRVDLAGQAVAAITLTLNLDTEFRLDFAERRGGFQVDGVPTDLQEGVAILVGVGPCGIRGPVTDGVLGGTPDTSFLRGDTRSVNIVLGSSGAPVGHAGHGQVGQLINHGGDKHGLISRQHSLAERDRLSSLIVGLENTSGRLTVVAVGEGFLDFAILVTVQTTPHGHGVRVGRRIGIPLHRHLAGRASVGAVVARFAGLVGAHSPTGVLLLRGDLNQASIGGELALSTPLFQNNITSLVVMAVAMAMFGGFSARNEGDKRRCAEGCDLELHCVGEKTRQIDNINECMYEASG